MPDEEKQSGLVPVRSAALARVGAKSLAARGHTELRRREEAEEWLRKGLEFQRAAPDDPRGRAPVNPYAKMSPVINKTSGAILPRQPAFTAYVTFKRLLSTSSSC